MRRDLQWMALCLLAATGMACSGNSAVTGIPCRTDRDCNGGLCQAGRCEAAGIAQEDGGGGGGGDVSLDEDLGAPDQSGSDATAEDGSSVGPDAADAADTADTAPPDGNPTTDATTDASEHNACGGTTPLDGQPGDSCGACNDGHWVCQGENAVTCAEAQPANVCGGCGPLPGLPGGACDACDGGEWTCGEDHALHCTCGGTTPNGTCAAPYPLTLNTPETISLCDQGDDEDPVAGAVDCRAVNVHGPDVVYRFTLDAPSTVTVDMRDDDSTVAIDTVVYLRSDCGNADSQLMCSDDVACDQSDLPDPCNGQVQVRQSTFQTVLDAGTYYVIADSFTYTQSTTAYGCGQIRLEVSR